MANGDFTFGDLKKILDTLTEKQLGCDVTVKDVVDDEFFGVCGFGINGENEDTDVIDEGHPFIRFIKSESRCNCGKPLVHNVETDLWDCVCGLSYERGYYEKEE